MDKFDQLMLAIQMTLDSHDLKGETFYKKYGNEADAILELRNAYEEMGLDVDACEPVTPCCDDIQRPTRIVFEYD